MMKNLLSLDPKYYLSEEIFQLEKEKIFNLQWHFICTEDELLRPGDTIKRSVMDRSIIVRRKQNGELCAFYNSCPHRGGVLLDSEYKNINRLRCMYHGWIYDDDGRLLAAPQFWDGEGIHKSCVGLSLSALKIKNFLGLVFVCLSNEGGSEFTIAASSEIINSDNCSYQKQLTFKFRTNWKLYVENWLENYHLGWLHNKLSQDVDISTYEVSVEQLRVFHQANSRGVEKVYGGIWAWHWPNFALNTYDIGYSIEIITPIDIAHTQVDYFFVLKSDVPENTKNSVYAMCNQVTNEDGQMCQLVQRNLEAKTFFNGPLSPSHEAGIAEFHRIYLASIS